MRSRIGARHCKTMRRPALDTSQPGRMRHEHERFPRTMPTQNDSRLTDAEHTEHDDGAQSWTLAHPAGPITLRIIHDEDCSSPLDPDWEDFLPALAMIGDRPRYVGTADDVPSEMELGCPHCQATGTLAAGECHDGGEIECKHCVGSGMIEADDIEQYLRVERDAVAVLEIDVGPYGEQSAVLYFTAAEIDGAGIPDADAALASHASEYRKWETGDCWGYDCTGPASDDSCWGFIGQEYALEEAMAAFASAVERADAEIVEASYWATRDVVTVS